MGDTTVGRLVKETVEILWEELHPLHMPLPTTESLKSNAKELENVWNFPHVIGCLDGKHIHTGCPRRNVPDFRRVFLMLNYTDITQNT